MAGPVNSKNNATVQTATPIQASVVQSPVGQLSSVPKGLNLTDRMVSAGSSTSPTFRQRMKACWENVRAFLKDHPDIFARVDAQLRQKLGLTGVKPADIPAVPLNGSAQAADAVKAPIRRQ